MTNDTKPESAATTSLDDGYWTGRAEQLLVDKMKVFKGGYDPSKAHWTRTVADELRKTYEAGRTTAPKKEPAFTLRLPLDVGKQVLGILAFVRHLRMTEYFEVKTALNVLRELDEALERAENATD